MTTEPKHWILRDEHGCVLGAAVIHPHHLTEESGVCQALQLTSSCVPRRAGSLPRGYCRSTTPSWCTGPRSGRM
jgi:hypothetical protein